MESIVRLRGHHVLCLLGFRGLGYDETFVENMKRVHARIFEEDYAIEIVEGEDDICSACPHLAEKCANGGSAKTRSKDASVLKLLSIRPGQRIGPSDLYRKVAESVTSEKLHRLCSGCRWWSLGYCAQGVERL